MKRIGFITTNKVLAQGLAVAAASKPELGFEVFLLLYPRQAALDAEVLEIEVAVVDVLDGASSESEAILTLCRELRRTAGRCRVLLLVSQADKAGRMMVFNAMKSKLADDFVFYDTSLEYLFAKLDAI